MPLLLLLHVRHLLLAHTRCLAAGSAVAIARVTLGMLLETGLGCIQERLHNTQTNLKCPFHTFAAFILFQP
jgi:hypothetical protein